MKSYTPVNDFTNKDAFLINPEAKTGSYGLNFQNYSEKFITYDSKKRQIDSNVFEKEIICKIYDSYQDDFITINTVAYDINKKGLIFMPNQPLEVGEPIFIRAKKVKNLRSRQNDNELDEGVHAQVIWCNKTFNQEHDLCYEVGVEYFN